MLVDYESLQCRSALYTPLILIVRMVRWLPARRLNVVTMTERDILRRAVRRRTRRCMRSVHQKFKNLGFTRPSSRVLNVPLSISMPRTHTRTTPSVHRPVIRVEEYALHRDVLRSPSSLAAEQIAARESSTGTHAGEDPERRVSHELKQCFARCTEAVLCSMYMFITYSKYSHNAVVPHQYFA